VAQLKNTFTCMQREQAILVAAMHRFRPILMTAFGSF
jgi:multidrug efflux pump subunit AcrB